MIEELYYNHIRSLDSKIYFSEFKKTIKEDIPDNLQAYLEKIIPTELEVKDDKVIFFFPEIIVGGKHTIQELFVEVKFGYNNEWKFIRTKMSQAERDCEYFHSHVRYKSNWESSSKCMGKTPFSPIQGYPLSTIISTYNYLLDFLQHESARDPYKLISQIRTSSNFNLEHYSDIVLKNVEFEIKEKQGYKEFFIKPTTEIIVEIKNLQKEEKEKEVIVDTIGEYRFKDRVYKKKLIADKQTELDPSNIIEIIKDYERRVKYKLGV